MKICLPADGCACFRRACIYSLHKLQHKNTLLGHLGALHPPRPPRISRRCGVTVHAIRQEGSPKADAAMLARRPSRFYLAALSQA